MVKKKKRLELRLDGVLTWGLLIPETQDILWSRLWNRKCRHATGTSVGSSSEETPGILAIILEVLSAPMSSVLTETSPFWWQWVAFPLDDPFLTFHMCMCLCTSDLIHPQIIYLDSEACLSHLLIGWFLKGVDQLHDCDFVCVMFGFLWFKAHCLAKVVGSAVRPA